MADPKLVPHVTQEYRDRLNKIAVRAHELHPGNKPKQQTYVLRMVRGTPELLVALTAQYLDNATNALLYANRPTPAAHPKPAVPQAVSDAARRLAGHRSPAPTTRLTTGSAATARAIAGVFAKSKLDTFICNGQPLGDLLAGEARRWGQSQQHQGQFVLALTENMQDNRRVREQTDGETANRLYARIFDQRLAA
jgi:hypothetical protein